MTDRIPAAGTMKPFEAPATEGQLMRTKQLLATFFIGVLALSACGDDDGEATVAERGITAGAGEATSQDWAQQVIDAWTTYQTELEAAAIAYVTDYVDGPGQVTLAITLFEAWAPAYEKLATSLPPSPADQQLAPPFESFVMAVDAAAQGANETLANLEAREDEYVEEISEAGIFGSSYEVTRLQFNEVDVAVDAACFPLQAALAAADLPLLPCADDGGGEDSAAGCSVDPLTEATGLERCFLEPGDYSFAVFGTPLTVTLQEPVLVSTGAGVVDFAAEDELMQFQVFAVNALADPSSLGAGEVEATVPLPLDLAAWAAELPVVVEATGVSTLLGMDAAYVQMRVDTEAALELGGDPIVAIIPSDSAWSDYFLFPDVTFTLWQVDHPTGTVVVVAADEDGPSDEVGWVESILGPAVLG